LVVAASHLAGGSLDIRVGDEILAVGSPPRAVSTEAELVDQLRGHLDKVVLTVLRDDAKVVIRGSWPAWPRIIERQALWISGAMFGAANPLLISQVRDAPELMVHHVEPGSDAEGAEFRAYDFLVSADGRKVETLADLETIAQEAASDQRPLSLVLLRLAPDADESLFLYQQRVLDAADIQRIGAPDTQVARAAANDHKAQ
jgi:S1-C subfamily serine protease